MRYRYPFTPFPKGWYRINSHRKELFAFGRELQLHAQNGEISLRETHSPDRTFPTIKKNGFVFTFFDEKNNKPYFDVPEIPEFYDTEWQHPFLLTWKIRTHAQEIAENALDLSHFCSVHTYKTIPILKKFTLTEHQFNVVMHSERRLLGFVEPVFMDITYHGMGIVVTQVVSHYVKLKVLLTTTPIDSEFVEINIAVALKKTPNPIKNRILRYMLIKDIYKEFSLDIPVWEAKIYRSKPLLCSTEPNIIRIRKWAQQFY